MTSRERNIAIGTGATLLVAALYQFAVVPFADARDGLNEKERSLQSQLDDADTLFSRQHRLRKIWDELQQGGLNLDSSQAEGQTLRSIIAWAEKAGVALSSLKPERSSEEQNFEAISFNVTGSGAMPDVARFMWAMETAPIPLRVTDVDIHPVKEGTDNLTIRISVSALCQPAATAAKTGSGGTR